VVRHESPPIRFELAFGRPAGALKGVVSEYFAWIDQSSVQSCLRELPSGNIPLIINFGSRVREYDRRKPKLWTERRAFISGLQDSAVLVEGTGPGGGIQVNFTALGARLFLARPLKEFTNQTINLDDVFNAFANRLEAQLFDARSWEGKFALLDREILQRLNRARHPVPAVSWAWQRLSSTAGRAKISDLVQKIGWSERYFSRQFEEQIGLTPKVLGRILRFHRAVRTLTRPAEVRLAELALDCGYYDQAHFTHDFREFSGITPSELMASRRPGGSGFATTSE
jgi:AraC-like DNA-binding protein